MRLRKNKIFNNLPKSFKNNIDKLLKEALSYDGKKIIVLDDDPTGIQTVHDVPVYTSYDLKDIRDIFLNSSKLTFILTNTRAICINETKRINEVICRRIIEVSREIGIDFEIISRSDSTLRGHYPLETDVLGTTIEQKSDKKVDGEVLTFSFFEAGRYTIGDIHYLENADSLIPLSETEFAKDSIFGYNSSDLRQYIIEKTNGKYRDNDIVSISIKDIRIGGAKRVEEILTTVVGRKKIIVNSANYNDLKVFTLGLLMAEKKGKNFIFRSAASFVKIRAGIKDKNHLKKTDIEKLTNEIKKGFIIVGSYVKKTTTQLNKLLRLKSIYPIEFNVQKILKKSSLKNEIVRCQKEINIGMRKSLTVLYTSRKVLNFRDHQLSGMKISNLISSSLVDIVKEVKYKPDFIIVKGGITSFDILVKALGFKKGLVLGQIMEGVPILVLGKETKFPGIPYIIFPGNVGYEDSLKRIIEVLVTS